MSQLHVDPPHRDSVHETSSRSDKYFATQDWLSGEMFGVHCAENGSVR